MRHARIKPRKMGYYAHIYNRIAGIKGELPFGDLEKEHFVQLIKESARLFSLDIISFQVMGNHYHIIIFVPENPPSLEEAVQRYNEYYKGKKIPIDLVNESEENLVRLAKWLNDPSAFIGMIQQRFVFWFNRTRPLRRHGRLWADRFKSTILQGEQSLLNALCYVELNAMRAGLVKDPADYRFGSWGIWQGKGNHPFAKTLQKHLNKILPGEQRDGWDLKDWELFLRREFARRYAVGKNLPHDEIHEIAETAAKELCLLETCHRRVRYWTDGGIIGSKKFIMELAGQFRSVESLTKRRLKRLISIGSDGVYSFKTLRQVPE